MADRDLPGIPRGKLPPRPADPRAEPPRPPRPDTKPDARDAELAELRDQLMRASRRQSESVSPPPLPRVEAEPEQPIVAFERSGLRISWRVVGLLAPWLLGAGGLGFAAKDWALGKISEHFAVKVAQEREAFRAEASDLRAELGREKRARAALGLACADRDGYIFDILDGALKIKAERPEGLPKPRKLKITAPLGTKKPMVVGGELQVEPE